MIKGGIGLALSKPKILTSDRNGAIYSVGIFEQCNKSIGESSEDCYKVVSTSYKKLIECCISFFFFNRDALRYIFNNNNVYQARGISEIEEWRWAGALFIIASILSVFSVGCVAMTFRYGGRWLKFVRISHATRNLLLFGKHFQICSLYLSEQTF